MICQNTCEGSKPITAELRGTTVEYTRQQPYHVEYTGSRPIAEVQKLCDRLENPRAAVLRRKAFPFAYVFSGDPWPVAIWH